MGRLAAGRHVGVGLAAGAAIGGLARGFGPGAWWNLASTPWYVAPLALPSIALVIVTSMASGVDVFTNAANELVVNTLFTTSAAVVGGVYGGLIGLAWRRIRPRPPLRSS